MTELEGAVLGVIWSRGPITAYGVRQRFMRSPTHGWSSSKGAIYPAIRRLTADGLVCSTPDPDDGRATRQLTLTEKGKEALRIGWRELETWMGGAVVDPVRTAHQLYWSACRVRSRLAFIERAERNAVAALKAINKMVPDPAAQERWGLEAADKGVRAEVEARLEWLRQVRKSLP